MAIPRSTARVRKTPCIFLLAVSISVIYALPTQLVNTRIEVSPSTVGEIGMLIVNMADFAQPITNGGVKIQFPLQFSIENTNCEIKSGISNLSVSREIPTNTINLKGDFSTSELVSFKILVFTNPSDNRTDDFLIQTYNLNSQNQAEILEFIYLNCHLAPKALASNHDFS